MKWTGTDSVSSAFSNSQSLFVCSHVHVKQRFQKGLLWRAFSKSSVFIDRFHWIRVDGSRIKKKKLNFQMKMDTCGQFLSVHPCILIKLCCAIHFSIYQSISVAALEVKCAWYLHSIPIHLLISLFPVICFELLITRTPATRTFSDFFNARVEGSIYRESTVCDNTIGLRL